MLPVCVDFIIMYTKTHFLFLFVELFCCCENSSLYFNKMSYTMLNFCDRHEKKFYLDLDYFK